MYAEDLDDYKSQVQIACSDNKNIYFAHMHDDEKNYIRFKCGVCLYGTIIYFKESKKIDKDHCYVCKCKFDVVKK
jgi:hypothetical protein